MIEKASETIKTETLGVASKTKAAPLKSDLAKAGDELLLNNVTGTKDGRRPKGTHPNPTIAQTVATMSLAGFTVKQVCEALRISPETLSEHYDHEMQHGRTNAMAQVVGSLAQRAIAGSDTAAIWLTKTRLGWSDRQQVDMNANIEVVHHRGELVSELAGLIQKGITIDAEPEPKE